MNMPSSFQTVIDHFKNHSWSFQLDPQRPLLHAGFKGKNGNFRLVAVVDESDDFLQVISFVPIVVPPSKRAAAAELCARLSFPMKIGNFELDCNDGELRFRTYTPYSKGELKDDVIRRVVGINLVMVDQHFPAFIQVIYGNESPTKAASQVRAPMLKGEPVTSQGELHPAGRISFN